MRFDLSGSSLRRLVLVSLGGVVLGFAVDFLAYEAGAVVNPWITQLFTITAALLFWLSGAAQLEVSDHGWEAPQVEPPVLLPREHRARWIGQVARTAEGKQAFTRSDLLRLLQGLAADRLVRHHGADPDDPFARAPETLSPGLWAWLDPNAPQRRPIRRATLDAYLKEIGSL